MQNTLSSIINTYTHAYRGANVTRSYRDSLCQRGMKREKENWKKNGNNNNNTAKDDSAVNWIGLGQRVKIRSGERHSHEHTHTHINMDNNYQSPVIIKPRYEVAQNRLSCHFHKVQYKKCLWFKFITQQQQQQQSTWPNNYEADTSFHFKSVLYALYALCYAVLWVIAARGWLIAGLCLGDHIEWTKFNRSCCTMAN